MPAWVALAATLAAVVVSLLLPGARPVLAVGTAWVSVLLVLSGVRLHRPRPAGPWLLLALVLVLWSVGATLVLAQGRVSTATTVVMGVGQAVAVAVAVRAGWSPGRQGRSRGAAVDLLVIAVVLALVGAQVTAVALSAGSSGLQAVLVPTVDVAVIGLLLRLVVSRRLLQPGAYLLLAAATATVGYDLVSAVGGDRPALPGEPAQVLSVLCGLLFGVAALHPTMTSALDIGALAQRRPPSASLVGLLPLVAVPLALWWVAGLTSSAGLPTWVFLVAAVLVAGLCLLRGAAALRSSEHLAEHDPLTDLANRRGLGRAWAEGSGPGRRSLLLVDVDEFKQVNDTHGHDVGDALLLVLRDRFLAATGDAGVVARFGGDEFVVLVRTERADEVAAEVLRTCRQPAEVAGLVLRVSASVGVAHAEDGASLADLLVRADVAMYAAKATGRDAALAYRPAMRDAVARRLTLTGEVRALLGGEAPTVGRLEVEYQPLVELATGVPVGAEALVRWRHPRNGLMAPGAFLDVVSTSGLDAQLDSVVLREVLRQLARWRDQGRGPLPVSVNLTRDSLADPDLAVRVLGALEEEDVPAGLLHLEITEHDELPEDSPAARSLALLHEAGVQVHLDDYGTGFTSLDYLRRFPVEVLKLDRSVVASVGEDHAQLVAGIAAMARTLSLDLLAEGVETSEQRQRLVELGIRYGQGFLFSRPLPAQVYADRVLAPVCVHGGEAHALPAPRSPALPAALPLEVPAVL